MDISDNLLCVFSARIDEHRDAYVIEIPKQELTTGALQHGEVYRTALLSAAGEIEAAAEPDARQERESSGPPVEEGEVRKVEVEDIGDQGDGIARVERGYVIIVPETEKGERVTIEITNVRENVAFSEVVEREEYSQ